MHLNNTIVALSTPLGRSGIGIIRLSGADALMITRRLIADSDFTFAPRRAYLKNVYTETNEIIDSALITYFAAPRSFTGEDVVEISGHGSPILLRQIVETTLKYDARLANPGEFSLRALANGQINLSQAEAIRDLIDANTTASARLAQRQLGGELSLQLQPLKDKLINVIVILESALEFVEDDLPATATAKIKQNLLEIHAALERFADTFRAGRLLREGLKIALVGRPNVGKSSLFNALLGHDRAIVTEIAGTTRDQLRESLNIKGIPIALVDTAGVRESVDVVEKIGVARTRQAIADADFVIVVIDASQPLTDEDKQVITETENSPRLIALNKSDLPQMVDENVFNQSQTIKISALTNFGLNELENAVIEPFAAPDAQTASFLISDARHHDLLRRAAAAINDSLPLIDARMSEEIILIGLHNALRFLDEITGETTPEDVLTRIFETFCIGK